MRTTAAIVALVLIPLGTLSACGQAEPVSNDPGFTTTDGDARLVARYREDARRAVFRVTVPDGTDSLRIRVDCVAKSGGGILVDVGSAGAGGVPCGDESSPGGFIGLSGGGAVRSGEQRVTVTAPAGAVWSFAVDAG